jgi:pimeloyl-ACP methyl ester carboxylesterase
MRVKRLLKVLASSALLVGGLAACSGATTTASVSAGDSANATASVDTAPANTVSINAGGPAMGSFRADQFFFHGATYGSDAAIDTSQVTSGMAPAEIFDTERWGAMTYTIPDRSGAQTVTLYFAENYVSGPGQRLFDVKINGTTVLSRFDIYSSAGGAHRAIARTFTTTADPSGQVVIQFVIEVQQPKISAITIAGDGTTATPPPATPSPTPATPPTNSPDAVASAGCGKAPALQNGTITVESNGTRSYILRAPDNYDSNHPYRLILAYHWMGGTAQQVAGGTGATESPFYGLWNLADNSTIFVAPVGLGSGQNTGWPNTGGRDVAFTDAILAQLEAGLCIDTSRIFATGFSYGAGMSYALACARPDVFRGVVLYSGGEISGCDGGTKPIAFYASHGLSDSTLDISMGRSARDHFVDVDGVAPQDPPEPAVSSGTHICTTYAGGSPRYPVEWCAFDGDHDPNPHDSGQPASWNPPQAWAFISQF